MKLSQFAAWSCLVVAIGCSSSKAASTGQPTNNGDDSTSSSGSSGGTSSSNGGSSNGAGSGGSSGSTSSSGGSSGGSSGTDVELRLGRRRRDRRDHRARRQHHRAARGHGVREHEALQDVRRPERRRPLAGRREDGDAHPLRREHARRDLVPGAARERQRQDPGDLRPPRLAAQGPGGADPRLRQQARGVQLLSRPASRHDPRARIRPSSSSTGPARSGSPT